MLSWCGSRSASSHLRELFETIVFVLSVQMEIPAALQRHCAHILIKMKAAFSCFLSLCFSCLFPVLLPLDTLHLLFCVAWNDIQSHKIRTASRILVKVKMAEKRTLT